MSEIRLETSTTWCNTRKTHTRTQDTARWGTYKKNFKAQNHCKCFSWNKKYQDDRRKIWISQRFEDYKLTSTNFLADCAEVKALRWSSQSPNVWSSSRPPPCLQTKDRIKWVKKWCHYWRECGRPDTVRLISVYVRSVSPSHCCTLSSVTIYEWTHPPEWLLYILELSDDMRRDSRLKK